MYRMWQVCVRSCALQDYTLNALRVTNESVFRQLQLIIDDQRAEQAGFMEVHGSDINIHIDI